MLIPFGFFMILTTIYIGWNLFNSVFNSYYVISLDSFPYGLAFNDNGSIMYVVGVTNKKVYQYSLSVSWDITSATYNSKNFDFTSYDSLPTSIRISPNGNTLYLLGLYANSILQFSLSIPWDISTASYVHTFSLGSIDAEVYDFWVSPDGLKMYCIGSYGLKVYKININTAWDISTAVYSNTNFSISSQTSAPRGMSVSNNGDKMYISDGSTGHVYQYDLSTIWDITTATYNNIRLLVSGSASLYSQTWKYDGTCFFIVDRTDKKIYKYTI